MKHDSITPITKIDGTQLLTALAGRETPEAQIARALSVFPAFGSWEHQPTPPALESMLLELNEQELMTAAAVCLLRLAKLQARDDADHADAA